jgi:hypothetical protein
MLLNFNVHVKYLKNLTSISSSVIPPNSPRRIFIEEYINSVCCLISINALTPMIVLSLVYSKSDIFAAWNHYNHRLKVSNREVTDNERSPGLWCIVFTSFIQLNAVEISFIS